MTNCADFRASDIKINKIKKWGFTEYTSDGLELCSDHGFTFKRADSWHNSGHLQELTVCGLKENIYAASIYTAGHIKYFYSKLQAVKYIREELKKDWIMQTTPPSSGVF